MNGRPYFTPGVESFLSRRELAEVDRRFRRWQRLDRAANTAYELGREREAETLSVAAAETAFELEQYLAEMEAESEGHVGAEDDVMRELAALWREHLKDVEAARRGRYTQRALEDRSELVRVLRNTVGAWAGGRVEASDAQLLVAAEDAYGYYSALRRRPRTVARDVARELVRWRGLSRRDRVRRLRGAILRRLRSR